MGLAEGQSRQEAPPTATGASAALRRPRGQSPARMDGVSADAALLLACPLPTPARSPPHPREDRMWCAFERRFLREKREPGLLTAPVTRGDLSLENQLATALRARRASLSPSRERQATLGSKSSLPPTRILQGNKSRGALPFRSRTELLGNAAAHAAPTRPPGRLVTLSQGPECVTRPEQNVERIELRACFLSTELF